jgi:anti-sigma factor RsiW
MSCEAIRPLLHAHVDGELDLVNELKVERHLASCPDCTRACQNLHALHSALRSLLPPVDTPPQLESRIRAALRAADPAPTRPLWRRAAGPGGLVLLLGIATWLLLAPDQVPHDVASSYQRFQISPHLEVESSDPVKVRDGFGEKLPFKPTVFDLSDRGFTLHGGRIDFVDGRPVAVLVYRDGLHTIDLLMWPGSRSFTPPTVRATDVPDLRMVQWAQSGMIFWAVADLGEPELLDFVALVRERTPACCR